jgi:DNA polymerase-4
MGIDPIWSVAPNKLVAKVATRIVKPVGEYIVGSGEEEEFLKPIPVHMIPGITSQDLKRFYDFNITLSGEAARLSTAQFYILFGNRGETLRNAVRGIDPSPVISFTDKKPVISAEHLFGNDTNNASEVERILFELTEQIGLKLRSRNLASRRMKLFIVYSDGCRADRRILLNPSANDFTLFAAVRTALEEGWKRRIRIRFLRLVADCLAHPPPLQKSLFEENKKNEKSGVIHAIDAVRNRFGINAICVARVLQSTL